MVAGSASAQITQVNTDIQQSRILILLDRSSSMVNNWSGNKARYQAADEIILQLIDSFHRVNDQVEFSLRALGEQHPAQENDCFDTRNEVMFSKDNYTQMALRLADMRPLGVTPIAYSLKEAAENDLKDEQHNAYSIILITDGGESCGGNICDVVKTLIQRKVYFKPYIVSLVDYAPLKTEYNCLGDYLQVVNDKDIPATVSKILNYYRPMLTITKTDYKTLVDKVKANPPSILHMDIPAVEVPKQDKTVITKAPPAPKPVPVIEKPVVVPRTPDNVSKMPVATATLLESEGPAVTTFKMYNTKPVPVPVVVLKDDPVSMLQIIKNVKPLPVSLKPFNAPLIIAISRPPVPKVEEPLTVTIPPPAAPKPAPVVVAPKPKPMPKPVSKPAPKPVADQQAPAKQMPLTTVNIDNKETTVEILFTDKAHSVYYHTSPQIILTDAVTGKEVKRFFRTVDPAGNPDPVPDIKPGIYNVTIVGREGGNIRGNNAVQVVDKKTNRITIEVSNGTLRFEYEGAPNRPIDEFNAVVVQRIDANGKIIKQRCSAELAYDPGNYFVEINTMPPSRRNVDIEFGGTTIVYLPIPGYVQFTNVNNLGKISLYSPLGDKYSRFYGMDISGNPAEQRLKLQPGLYQAHFIRDPKAPFASEKIVSFSVKSDAITDVELK